MSIAAAISAPALTRLRSWPFGFQKSFAHGHRFAAASATSFDGSSCNA